MATAIETTKVLGVLVRLWEGGNEYHYSFVIDDQTYKGDAPNRDGAIAFVYERIKECQQIEKVKTKN